MFQDNSRLKVAIQVKTELGTAAKKSSEIARRPIGLSKRRGLVHPQHVVRFLNPKSGVLRCAERNDHHLTTFLAEGRAWRRQVTTEYGWSNIHSYKPVYTYLQRESDSRDALLFFVLKLPEYVDGGDP